MRRCSYCGQHGHYRPTCPEVQSAIMNQDAMGEPAFEEELLDNFLTEMDIEGVLQDEGVLLQLQDGEFFNTTPIIEELIEQDPVITLPPMPPPPPEVPYTSCVICMEDFTTQPKTELRCRHAFCTGCIMTNLEHGNLECPMCRDTVMGPSKKIVELQETISIQYNELCDQDQNIIGYERRVKALKSELTYKEKTIRDIKKIIQELNHSLHLDSIEELQTFTESVSAEYEKIIHEYGEHSPTLTPPTLKELIYSLFTKKEKKTIKLDTTLTHVIDIRGQLLTHDTWVKIIFGPYKNYMGRFMWKSYANKEGKYIIRVHVGLGKPKLGKGIYDSSYTKDIDFYTYTTSSLGAIVSCTPLPCMCIPNDVVHYKIQGNGTRLDKITKQMLSKEKLQILLERVAL